MTQVEREIKHLSNIIAETEQKINVYKFNKDNKEPRESNQNNSFLLSLISNAEGSMLDIQASVSRIQNPKKKDQPLEEKKSCCLIF